MSDTAPMEAPTQVNEQRLYLSILADLEGRILDVVCAALTPRFSIALAVLVILGIVQAALVNTWIADLRTDVAAQDATLDGAVRQLATLEGDVVRKEQLQALQQQVKELDGAARALSGTLRELRRQQEQLSTSVSTVSGLVLSVENRVGDEQAARRELTQEIKGLAAQLRARQ